MKLVRIVALVLVAAAVSAFVGVGVPEAAHGVAAQNLQEITAIGNGTATAVPDRASFWFGVQTERKTATDALASNSREMRKIIAAVKGAGVRDADVQTSEISLSPHYEGSNVVGYVAQNAVTATIRDLGKIGPVVDAAVGAGADQVSGPSLTASDVTALHRSALRAAVADGRSRAEALASAAGVQLGAVTSIDEGQTAYPLGLSQRTSSDTAPLEPGTQNVDASVTVTFAIA